ncbi:MAG: class I SAM-dependent methyltransferase [Chitinophagaceae bacterium]
MYSRFQLTKKYLHYYLTASNAKGHGIHSPFVYEFVKNVLNDHKHYTAYDKVESMRRLLLTDESLLEIHDLGAGSSLSARPHRKVAHITRYAVKPKKYGQLLFRIVQYHRPRTIVELGTSLGLTTAYLAMADTSASVITLEGAREVAHKAGTNLKDLGLTNVNLIQGNFDDVLTPVLESVAAIDLSFIDGNHRKEPTLRYYAALSQKTHTSSVLIFDDIHWSREMEAAWEIIKADKQVTLTVDLFFVGLVFFKKEFKTKQHFTIRY